MREDKLHADGADELSARGQGDRKGRTRSCRLVLHAFRDPALCRLPIHWMREKGAGGHVS